MRRLVPGSSNRARPSPGVARAAAAPLAVNLARFVHPSHPVHVPRWGESMRIAQVAPLYESVPPKGYGGTERVVSYLTEQLVAEGHAVTLFASGDSVTAARLVAARERALRRDGRCRDPVAAHFRMLGQVADLAPQFDLIHFHIDYL